MRIRFWGTRGSIPTPGSKTARYGGNTSCVELRVDDGTVIILDCGTGARQLGQELLKEGIRRIHLLVGHTHWDHIQGFPFFTPAALAEYELNIFAPAGFQQSLEDALAGQMQYSYFPVKLQELSSRIHFTELEEGLFRIGEVLVETQYLNHTAPTIAYRISHGGSTLAYVTDHEPFWNSRGPGFQHPGDQRHIEFLKDADLVIHDAQYTEEEYRTKRGWGHSTVDYATDVAIAAGAGRLALFHHDPGHDDETVAKLEEHARARAAAGGSPLQVFAAVEGMSLELSESGAESMPQRGSALDRRPIRGGRILVVSGHSTDLTEVEQILMEEDLIVVGAGNGPTALAHAAELLPDLVILDPALSDGGDAHLIQSLRDVTGKTELPVLILARHQDEAALDGPVAHATDYLTYPYSPPMLRSRVRSWLARTMSSAPEDKAPVAAMPAAASWPAREVLSIPEIVASVDLFRSLPRHQVEKLIAGSSQRQYPQGYSIIQQGQRGRSVYVVLSGRVRVAESLPDHSAEIFVAELRQGEVFGELGVLKEHIRAMSVVALERTACLVIPDAEFMAAAESSPELALGLVRRLSKRLLEADRTLARYGPDPLTGLPGRRAFHELYKRVSAGARRRGNSVLLIAVDVVRLKSLNDQYGYRTGDAVLRTVAEVLLECSRGTDLIARYGNDEFAALFVEAGAEHVDIIVGRIHEKFHAALLQKGLPAEALLRIGFAVGEKPPETVDELLRAADAGIQNRGQTTRVPISARGQK